MILTKRVFVRRPATRDAKSIFIFCEGVKREFQYFEYFKEIDSRINIEVYKLSPDENNSPPGLYQIALDCLIKSEENPNPKYEFIDGDETWIVVDTDVDKLNSRTPQIEKLREDCNANQNWNVAQSNPCFEVWLYDHFFNDQPAGDDLSNSKFWKKIVNEKIGGFNSKKHPIYIYTAIVNSERKYSETNNAPNVGSTQVFKLATVIYPLIKEKINEALALMENN